MDCCSVLVLWSWNLGWGGDLTETATLNMSCNVIRRLVWLWLIKADLAEPAYGLVTLLGFVGLCPADPSEEVVLGRMICAF